MNHDSLPLRRATETVVSQATSDVVPTEPDLAAPPPGVPGYLRDVYSWCYLSATGQRIFDHPTMVSAILWGNARRLIRAVEAELEPGQRVLQAACVYGDFSPCMARRLGRDSELSVIDIAPNQVRKTRRKLAGFPQASVRVADARQPGVADMDVAISFFLLHEVPGDYKVAIVDALLDSVRPGGRVVFVDYHRMHWLHPLRPIMAAVYGLLEPFARELVEGSIPALARHRDDVGWGTTETYFGGLYQKVIATRL